MFLLYFIRIINNYSQVSPDAKIFFLYIINNLLILGIAFLFLIDFFQKKIEEDKKTGANKIYSDDEDDGWTNVDEPPEEPYYPENYENYDDFEDSDGEKAGTSNGNAGQNDAKLKLIEALSVIDVFAANAVEKTDGWMVKASEVETTIASEYEKGILDKRIQTISEELSKIYGKPMTFVVNLSQVVPEKKQQTQASTELPEQIKILMNTFKGSIIAGK